MDAHYDQTMRARAQAANSPPRQYFAYSTILDRHAFSEWRNQHGFDFFSPPAGEIAEALDVSLVFDFPSRFWGGRVAGLRDQPGASVFGRLMEIPGVDWPIIQHKEGRLTGMCVEREIRVRVGTEVRTAVAFTTSPERMREDGPISLGFCEALIRGARDSGLPEDWVQKLRTYAG